MIGLILCLGQGTRRLLLWRFHARRTGSPFCSLTSAIQQVLGTKSYLDFTNSWICLYVAISRPNCIIYKKRMFLIILCMCNIYFVSIMEDYLLVHLYRLPLHVKIVPFHFLLGIHLLDVNMCFAYLLHKPLNHAW
jgi:hypothetical protein